MADFLEHGILIQFSALAQFFHPLRLGQGWGGLFSRRRFAYRFPGSDAASHAISSITIPSGVVNQWGFPGTAAHPKAEAFFIVSALSDTWMPI